MVTYYKGHVNVNNAHNVLDEVHVENANISDSQTTLLSGTWCGEADKVNIFFHNGHASASMNFQVWGSIASGASKSLSASISGGGTWATIGDPVVVPAGNSALKSYEVTNTKWIAVTGSASANATGAYVRLSLKTKM